MIIYIKGIEIFCEEANEKKLSLRLPQITKEICGSSLRFEKERLVSCPRFRPFLSSEREREREREREGL